MGSMVAWKPNKLNLVKTILRTDFKTRDEAIIEERRLIIECINDDLNQNYNIPGVGFHNNGRIFSDTTRQKMRLARLGDKNPNFGKIQSEEVRRKISESAKNRIYTTEIRKKMSDSSSKKRIVQQFDKSMIFIAEYQSVSMAGVYTKTDKGDITRVCKNQQKSAGGYIWKYKQIS